MSYFFLKSRSLKIKWSKKSEKCNFISPDRHNSRGPLSVNPVFVSETCTANVTYVPSDLPSDRELLMDRALLSESQGFGPWESSHLPLCSHSHPPFCDKNKNSEPGDTQFISQDPVGSPRLTSPCHPQIEPTKSPSASCKMLLAFFLSLRSCSKHGHHSGHFPQGSLQKWTQKVHTEQQKSRGRK